VDLGRIKGWGVVLKHLLLNFTMSKVENLEAVVQVQLHFYKCIENGKIERTRGIAKELG